MVILGGSNLALTVESSLALGPPQCDAAFEPNDFPSLAATSSYRLLFEHELGLQAPSSAHAWVPSEPDAWVE